MDALRANEKLIELHGEGAESAGGVKDWQADRLASSLARIEDLFDQALAFQKSNGPVGDDVAQKVQAALADVRTIAGRDEKSLTTLREYSGRFVAAAQDLKVSSYPQGPVTALANLLSQEFAQSDYHSLSKAECTMDANAERLSQRAHAMVRAGYIQEQDLQGVEVAVTALQSANALASERFHALAESVSGVEQFKPALPDTSVFQGGYGSSKINVHEDEAILSIGNRPEPVVEVFSHELGHWLARNKSASMLQEGARNIVALGGAEAALVEKLLPIDTLTPERLADPRSILGQEIGQGSGRSISGLSLVHEMQADILSIAAEHAEFGKAAALATAYELINFRRVEQISGLAEHTELLREGPVDAREIRFTSAHHTTLAVQEFAARVEAGDLDKVKTPAQFDKLVGETVTLALVKEYAQSRAAELNVHHIEDGRVVPGLPPELSMVDVLAAEMLTNLRHPVGAPTILVTAEESKRLPPDAQLAELNVLGRISGGDLAVFHLSTKAPDGVLLPAIAEGTVRIGGHEVDTRLAPFASTVAEQGQQFMDKIAASPVLQVPEGTPRTEIGRQERQAQEMERSGVSTVTLADGAGMAM